MGIHLVRLSVCLSVPQSVGDMVSGAYLKFALEFQFQSYMHIVFGCGQKPIDFQRCRSLST